MTIPDNRKLTHGGDYVVKSSRGRFPRPTYKLAIKQYRQETGRVELWAYGKMVRVKG